MLNRETIVTAIETHCRALSVGDREGWLRLWADDAILEDPVGVDTFRGIGALGTTFWELVRLTSPLHLAPQEDIIVCGNEAVAILSAESSWGGTTRSVGPIVDHFTFGPDGKIAAMRAHWHHAADGYRPDLATEPTRREHIVAAIRTHCRAENALDKETWLSLFAENAVVEDPVGLNTTRGIAALATDFWSSVERARPKLRLLDDAIVSGNEAIAVVSAEIDLDGQRQVLAPIVVNFIYDEAGKVERLRSFINYG
jgi:steroid Delta-isomerase